MERSSNSLFPVDRGQHNGKSRWGKFSYGYLWWIVDDYCYAAFGDGGNVIYINPKQEMVITIASRFMPRAKDRIEMIRTYIMPLFE